VSSAPFESRPARWLAYAGLFVLVVSVFASQLYLAGYVRPWPRAFAAEAVYWLSWWILLPAVVWWCRRLRHAAWAVRAPALLLGALVALVVAPVIAQSLHFLQNWLHLCVGGCEAAHAGAEHAAIESEAALVGVAAEDVTERGVDELAIADEDRFEPRLQVFEQPQRRALSDDIDDDRRCCDLAAADNRDTQPFVFFYSEAFQRREQHRGARGGGILQKFLTRDIVVHKSHFL